MKNSKIWSVLTIGITLLCLVFVGGFTAFVDPMFHYHSPLERLEYPIDNQRYQNDGIVTHFDYDAIITGTSLTENFKASEFDALFGTDSVKVCFSGATLTEISQNLRRALESNDRISYVLCGIDGWFLFETYGTMRTDAAYPTYLYDENLLNDVQYLLNKEIFFEDTMGVLEYTVNGNVTTNFDDYSNWADSEYGRTGREIVMKNYARPEIAEQTKSMTPERQRQIEEILNRTIVDLANTYPDVQFICFFPPYSILYWDQIQREGTLERQVQAFEIASDLLLKVNNIQLFSFYDNYELTEDLDQYRDAVHYGGAVNSQILQWIHDGQYQLTKETSRDYWAAIGEKYAQYDYDALFPEES